MKYVYNKEGCNEKEPYINLVGSIIKQAVSDLTNNRKDEYSERRRKKAREWFTSNSKEPNSLIYYCDLVDLDVDEVRKMAGIK